jgi:AcrR family transcriptional regulator
MPISPSLKARREKEKEALKKKILFIAKKIAVKEGWESVTIRRIASEISYSLPVIYSHFKDKAEIINLISNLIANEILNRVNAEYIEDSSLITLTSVELEAVFNTKKISMLAYDKSIIMDLLLKRDFGIVK